MSKVTAAQATAYAAVAAAGGAAYAADAAADVADAAAVAYVGARKLIYANETSVNKLCANEEAAKAMGRYLYTTARLRLL